MHNSYLNTEHVLCFVLNIFRIEYNCGKSNNHINLKSFAIHVTMFYYIFGSHNLWSRLIIGKVTLEAGARVVPTLRYIFDL